MWVNHKWLWLWVVVVKRWKEGGGGVVPYFQDVWRCLLQTAIQNAVYQLSPFLLCPYYLLFHCHITQLSYTQNQCVSGLTCCACGVFFAAVVKSEGRE